MGTPHFFMPHTILKARMQTARPPIWFIFLLTHGAKPDVKSKDGSTPLMWAAAKGESGIVQILTSAGADVNATDANGKNALMYGIEGQADPEMTKILISRGAKIDIQDIAGETALIKSCRRKRSGMTMALVQLGANLNLQDKQGQTALMVAAAYGNATIADGLLKAGANPALKNNNGQTALDIARDQHTAAFERLESSSQ